ncbi:MAG: glycosyltransferase family 39 protein, partial [Lachnospiraceae bacterium]|nr:glycosyltransferase family 39 protein [Lachnospiraceae bacterium]
RRHLLGSIRRQFYHPPLFHFLAASVYDMMLLFGADNEGAFECVQLMNTYVAGGCTIVIYFLLKRFPVHPMMRIPMAAGVSFFPFFYVLGTEINNDCLATLFSLLALLAAFHWADTPDGKHFFLMSLFFVLSMWTKWSEILTMPVILCIIFCVMWKRPEDIQKLLAWPFVFVFLVVPLGMGWMFYLSFTYHVPLFFVPTLEDTSRQFLGDLSAFDRLRPGFFFELSSFVTDLSNGRLHGNIWSQTALTAVFDEGILVDANPLLGRILLWTVLVFGMLSLICVVWVMFEGRADLLYRSTIPVGFAVLITAYVFYCFLNPFISAINFRYIPCILMYDLGAAGIVLSTQGGFFRGLIRVLWILCILIISVESSLLYLFYAV